jgi:serpin B
MTYAGARGETATQIAETLGFTLDQPALHAAFNTLNRDLAERGNIEADPGNYQPARGLLIANGVWGEQTYPFSETFSTEIERYYGTGLQMADFVNAPDDSREQINLWGEEQTKGRIQDIVPPGVITPATRLVLANAIYFYGRWFNEFRTDDTRDAPFHLLDGTTVMVPFMFQKGLFAYAQGGQFQAVELSYWPPGLDPTGEFALTVILPNEGRLEKIESGLNADTFNAVVGQLDYAEVLLYLPKFTYEARSDLVSSLEAMGMMDAFIPERADFSGMVDGPMPEPLWIEEVLHKAFISVDEEGTEAAAETLPSMPGAAPPGEEPPEIRIDRPFLFAIRDTETGTVLFLGRVMDPRG